MAAKKQNFEENIKELEKIVNALEGGDAPLDDCIDMFEKGVKLSDECFKMLNKAEQKIKILTQDGEKDFTLQDTDNN